MYFDREASVRILPQPEGTDIVSYLENAFNEIREYAVNSGEENDYVRITFISSDLTRGPAGLSFRPARDLIHTDIWNLVSSLAQSTGGHDIVERFEIFIFNVTFPTGSGQKSNKLMHEDVAKPSILTIENADICVFPVRSSPLLFIASAVTYERGNYMTGGIP